MTLNPLQQEFLVRYLGVPLPRAFSDSDSAPQVSVAKLAKAKIEWLSLRGQADMQIASLKQEIFNDYKDTPSAQSQVQAAFNTLDSTFARLDERLTDAIDAVLNGNRNAGSPVAVKARKTVEYYISFVNSDPVMQSLDSNDITSGVKIAGPIKNTLLAMSAALAA